jgi:hypothetical protein
MGFLLSWYVKLALLLGPIAAPINPPQPNEGAANSFPIQFDRFFGALLSLGMKIGGYIGAVVFVFMLVGALKERPVRWAAIITDGVSIAALVIMAAMSNQILTWIANLI